MTCSNLSFTAKQCTVGIQQGQAQRTRTRLDSRVSPVIPVLPPVPSVALGCTFGHKGGGCPCTPFCAWTQTVSIKMPCASLYLQKTKDAGTVHIYFPCSNGVKVKWLMFAKCFENESVDPRAPICIPCQYKRYLSQTAKDSLSMQRFLFILLAGSVSLPFGPHRCVSDSDEFQGFLIDITIPWGLLQADISLGSLLNALTCTEDYDCPRFECLGHVDLQKYIVAV